MAVISDLVRIVAEVEGFEENFVSVYARSAREAGYISHHGRGRNASKMTALDAAHLLIAVNASPLAKDVPQTISTYKKMRCQSTRENNLSSSEFGAALGKEGTTIVEALSFLLQIKEDGDLWINDLIKVTAKSGGIYPVLLNDHLFIQFIGPQPMAMITVKSWHQASNDECPSLHDAAVYSYIDIDHESDRVAADRTVTTTISSETIYQVAKIINFN